MVNEGFHGVETVMNGPRITERSTQPLLQQPLSWREIKILYSTYILQVFNFMNFVNFESFAKSIRLKFELLCCQAHGQHASVKFF